MQSNGQSDVLLYVSNLKKYFEISNGFRTTGYVRALDGATFSLRRGETIGVVGETGCGKTTLGRTILGLIKATEGDVYFDLPVETMNTVMEQEERLRQLVSKEALTPDETNEKEDLEDKLKHTRKKYSLTKMRERKLKHFRNKLQPIFQDPFSSLDPRKLIKDTIAEPMKLLTDMSRPEIFEKERELISSIGLSEDHLYRFPHEFSGGQRQRIVIARAISIDPSLLVLDEPTSALDVSVQAQILNILKDVQDRKGLSYIFISHHLSVIRVMADRVAVMYLGQIIEFAPTPVLFSDMLHPYTRALLTAIPIPDPRRKREKIVMEGEIPSPVNPPKGCYFHPRCPVAMINCGWSPRDMAEPFKHMLDRSRNVEAAQLPETKEIVLDEETNELEILFEAPLNDSMLSIFNQLVEKEAAGHNGIRFKAIGSVNMNEGRDGIIVRMIKPEVPTLKQIRPDHFVSCLIYDKPGWRTESPYAKEVNPRIS